MKWGPAHCENRNCSDIRAIEMEAPEFDPRPQSDQACVFCALRSSDRIVLRNDLAFALRDTTPVSYLHSLVLPFRHAPTHFDLTMTEIEAANDLLWRLRAQILATDSSVGGFNIGANAGLSSGQTIFHCHIHLIPRRGGDVENPLGGVRGVIPNKMRY